MWPEWDRYLELDERRAYHIGDICNTCAFFFQRLGGANRSVTIHAVAALLEKGLTTVDDDLLDTLAPHLPAGPYTAALLDLEMEVVSPGDPGDYFAKEQIDLWGVDAFWGLPHDPRTQYYRAPVLPVAPSAALYQFLVPMHPASWLNDDRVNHYRDLARAGEHPTALALSVLDIKGPAGWQGSPSITEHWVLAHYLLDGHHKTYAAVQSGRPIRVLSLVARQQGVSAPAQVDIAMDRLQQAAA